MLLVHHFLENGGGIHARNVVILKSRHEGYRTCGDYQMLGIYVAHLAVDDILDSYATTFEQIPNGVVQQDAFVVVASQRFGNIEAAHTAKLLLFLEEEELVSLHVELTTDIGVVVYHDIADAEGVELLATGEACRTCTDDGDLGLVDFHLTWLRLFGVRKHVGLVVDGLHFLHAVDKGNADAADFAIDQHFASTAFADAAVEASVASVKTVAVDGITSLVKGGGNGLASLALYGFAFVFELHKVFLRDVQNGVFFDFVHVTMSFES